MSLNNLPNCSINLLPKNNRCDPKDMVLTVRSIVCWTRRRDPCPRWCRMAPPPAAALSRRRVALAARVKRPWVWRPSLAFRFFSGERIFQIYILRDHQKTTDALEVVGFNGRPNFGMLCSTFSSFKFRHVMNVAWQMWACSSCDLRIYHVFFGGASWLYSIIVNDLNFYFAKAFFKLQRVITYSWNVHIETT